MANITETTIFDAGIYRIETGDPVIGGETGIDNIPHKNLANRTGYLKTHVDALESQASLYAPLNSPIFTGSGTAPTQALGDNTTKLATDAFVQGTVGGFLSKSVAGSANITLSAVEAGNGILRFTGAITANISVIVPASPTRGWIIQNLTSGAFTVTVKLATGTGTVISQGYNASIWTDGTDVYHAVTEQSTETVKGISEVATQVETNAGTDDARIVTPLKLLSGFSQSFGDPGSLSLPACMGGWIIQMGHAVVAGGAGHVVITFATPFPSSFFADSAIAGGSNIVVSGVSANTTSRTYICTVAATGAAASNGTTISWIAIGR
jgi:hypothetical protein